MRRGCHAFTDPISHFAHRDRRPATRRRQALSSAAPHLPHVLLFAILAMLAGANSYRAIHSFIDVHLARLRDSFALPWRRAPAYTTIRFILQQLNTASVGEVFRSHAAILYAQTCPAGERHVALDGKALRHSFDHFQDRKAAHILNAFACDAALVLAHLDCDEKSNEIPAVQALLAELGLAGAVVPVDASQKTYGPPRCKWLLRVHHDRSASTYPASDQARPRWRYARPVPHKLPGVERHFFDQVSRTPFDCQAISLPPLANTSARQ